MAFVTRGVGTCVSVAVREIVSFFLHPQHIVCPAGAVRRIIRAIFALERPFNCFLPGLSPIRRGLLHSRLWCMLHGHVDPVPRVRVRLSSHDEGGCWHALSPNELRAGKTCARRSPFPSSGKLSSSLGASTESSSWSGCSPRCVFFAEENTARSAPELDAFWAEASAAVGRAESALSESKAFLHPCR